MPTGRFAPSPTGPLHLGNLRTALVAWLFARSDGSRFLLRFDDVDGAARDEYYRRQIDDLAALGLDWDGPPLTQRQRHADGSYDAAVAQLTESGELYECYCSRREIREAAQAPNNPLAGHAYPGTCRDLGPAERARRRTGRDRPPALRLRTGGESVGFVDRLAGPQSHAIDDFVVVRNDGTPAYHLMTVIDDADLGVELVVRGDDLLDSTSRQHHLARLLGLAPVAHAHVPLVLSGDGARLAKRHGAVTLADRAALGEAPADVLAGLAASLGLAEPGERISPAELLARFDPALLPTEPLVLSPDALGGKGG